VTAVTVAHAGAEGAGLWPGPASGFIVRGAMAPIPLSSEPGGSLPAERLAADKRARAGLVLERPLTGTEAGVERTVSHGSSGS
jgi:hypothetical protein